MLRESVAIERSESGSGTSALASATRMPIMLSVVGREALAFARQAPLIYRDVNVSCPERLEAGQDVVVLLHGLFATAGVFRPLRTRIESEAQAATASFSYLPGPGVVSVARKLGAVLSRLPASVRVHLVGHSMGGLAARWFVQKLGGDERIVQTISLASPFHGTRHARLLPGPAGRDICPGSRVLSELEASAHRAERVPHLSIASAKDPIVTESALFAIGDRLIVPTTGHNGLLFDPLVASEIARRVRRLSALAGVNVTPLVA
jgi:triacylglycerol lipase